MYDGNQVVPQTAKGFSMISGCFGGLLDLIPLGNQQEVGQMLSVHTAFLLGMGF